jgi:hypothetical protein
MARANDQKITEPLSTFRIRSSAAFQAAEDESPRLWRRPNTRLASLAARRMPRRQATASCGRLNVEARPTAHSEPLELARPSGPFGKQEAETLISDLPGLVEQASRHCLSRCLARSTATSTSRQPIGKKMNCSTAATSTTEPSPVASTAAEPESNRSLSRSLKRLGETTKPSASSGTGVALRARRPRFFQGLCQFGKWASENETSGTF